MQLENLCEKSLEAVNYELVDLEYQREGHGWVLRVFIDHPFEDPCADEGTSPSAVRGITHQDCANASRHLSAVLDVEDPIETNYRLEVSSPGIRRPLRKERDFARFLGQNVKMKLTQPIQGRRKFAGELLAASGGSVTVALDGEHIDVPFDCIKKAHLDVEF